MSQQTVTLTFQDPSATVLAGGSVTLRLNVDGATAVSNGTQVAAGRVVMATLDSTGTVSILIWPNDQLSPSGTVYFVDAYTDQGEPVWSGQASVTGSGTVTWITQ